MKKSRCARRLFSWLRPDAGIGFLIMIQGLAATVSFATAPIVTRPSSDSPVTENDHVAWRFRMDSPYVLHRQAVAPDGTVYVQDVHGFLYALDHDGALQWVYNAGSYPNGGGGEGPVALHPDGTIVVVGNPLGPNVEVHAVNPNGTRRWVFTDTNTQGVIAGPAVGPDGNIYFATDYGGLGLVCLSSTGNLLWNDIGSPQFLEYGQLGEEIAFGPGEPGSQPTQLYVAFDERNVAPGDLLYGFTLAGDQRFASATGGQSDPLGQRQGQPAVGIDGNVYICALIGNQGWRLQAFNPSNGQRIWTYFPTQTNVLTEPNVGPDGTIYVGRNLGELHAVRPNATQRWVYTDPGILFGPVASPANDIVLAGGRITYGAPGFVKAVNVADGTLLWTVDLPTEGGYDMIPFSRPSFAADGLRAYISTTLPGQPSGEEYSYLYAIDVDVTVSVAGGESNRASQQLVAWPNPFSAVTEVSFRAPPRRSSYACVFDLRGSLVCDLSPGVRGEGEKRLVWDGRDAEGREVPRGAYLIRVESGAWSGKLKVIRVE